MIAATTIPLLIAGALLLFLFGFSIFIACSYIMCLISRKKEKPTKSIKAVSKQPAATTRTAAARSRSPFHRLTDTWHRNRAHKRPSDIEIQNLPRLTPKGTHASDDADAMTIWPIYSGGAGAGSPTTKTPSPTDALPPVTLPTAATAAAPRLPQEPRRLMPSSSLVGQLSAATSTTVYTTDTTITARWLSPPTAPDYPAHHAARAHILARHHRASATVLLSTPAAAAACAELLETVLAHLCLAYPETFEMQEEADGKEKEERGGWRGGVGWRVKTKTTRKRRRVENKGTAEVWEVDELQQEGLLEVVARLAEEDFGVFVLGGGGWRL